jgi:antitoxin component YwqK of YwqJK toxin-antitoxin module
MMKNLWPYTLLFILGAACNSENKGPAPAHVDQDTTKVEAPLNGRQVIPVRGGGQMEGLMRNGKRHGPWVSRFPNGTIRSRTNYVNGVEEGPVEVFYGNTVTYYQGRHLHGKPYGEWVFNDTLGNEMKRVRYDSTGVVVRK